MEGLYCNEKPLNLVNKKLGTQFKTEKELQEYLRESLREFDETMLSDYAGLSDLDSK